LVFYLDPKPNAYSKKIATPCHSAEKINFPNFFIKSFFLHSKLQLSLSSLGIAVLAFFISHFRKQTREYNLSYNSLIQKTNQLSKLNRTRAYFCHTSILTIDKRRNLL